MFNILKQKIYFNSKAKDWDNIAIHDAEKITHILDDLNIKNGNKVLDIGCGTGILIPHIVSRLGKTGKVIAVDFAKKMIELAKIKNNYSNVSFINGDIYKLKLENNSFDCVLCYSVFPHFEDKNRIIKKIYKLLKPEGKILIAHSQSRDQINSLHSKLEKTVVEDSLPDMNSIIYMLENTGFEIKTSVDNADMFYVIGIKK